jgi:peptidoglycan/xylan/chitin deacetylase (PgdA/CDA1 family)
MKKVADAGHEVGLHGYSHEVCFQRLPSNFGFPACLHVTDLCQNPGKCSVEQQRAVLEKSFDLIKQLTGKPPRGTCAPFNELSATQAQILEELGVEYDNSLAQHDCLPYWYRDGDSWTKVDYDKPAETWMKPFKYGTKKLNLVEIPCSW